MSEIFSSDPAVALAASNAAGIAALRAARDTLDAFGVAWKECVVPGVGAGAFDATGLRAMIVASPDAALPGRLAAETRLPVVRVPVAADGREGVDLLYDPATSNLPVGDAAFATVAIGEAGAKNAALFVVSMLGMNDARLRAAWLAFRQRQTDAVLNHPPLENS